MPTADNASIEIEQIGDGRYWLGEGPLWDPVDQVLYFVDVVGQSIWRYTPETAAFKQWKLDDVVSSLALTESGNAIITRSDGFYTFDFDSGESTRIGEALEADLPTRFNDGKVDRQGRFIAGTMHNEITQPLGTLYSLSTDRKVSVLDTNIVCSNGPCWSPDGTTLYFTDSMHGQIYAYDYNTQDGTVGPRRIFVDFRKLGIPSAPDGCTADAEGYLWSAQCLAGKIARISPQGEIDRLFDMPVKYVTSVMFGGKNLDTLYVTTLNIPINGRPPEEPNAGALFAIHGLGVKGIPEPRFAG